ncbi:MAG: HD domain-containing protein, partial [Ginsengibacter sp.]
MPVSIPIPLEKIQIYVESLYNRFKKPELLYHNLQHTQKVVEHSKEIAAAYSVKEIDQFVLIVAAWFHDTGQLVGFPLNHEDRSVVIMKDYLEKKIPDINVIDSISGCIMATKISQQPQTFIQEILCDADTYNLGTKEFIYTDKQLKKEFKLRNNIPSEGWDR